MLSLASTIGGAIDLAAASTDTIVLYIHPQIGRPGVNPPLGWDAVSGSRYPAGAATTLEAGRCCGSLDVGLSDEGREQALLLVATLGRVELAALYTSPLERARQTAAAIADRQNLVPNELPGLAEINFGELEGRRFEEIVATHPDVYATWMSRPTEVDFPAGERFGDFARRVRVTTRDIRLAHDREAIAIVTHGGPIRIVVADALAMPPHALFRLDQSFTGLSVVDWIEGSPIVRLFNATTT